MKLDFLDPTILEDFKREINEHDDFLIKKFGNFNGRKKISAIFSAKDWLHIIVNGMPHINLYHKNDDVQSMNVMQFVSMIDLLTEAVQQIYRVLFNCDNYPLTKDRSIFNQAISDDKYFSHIRAAFAAHPVNLDSNTDGINSTNRYFASWSSAFGKGDFSVIFYSNDPNEQDKEFSIYFNDIIKYAKKRYMYLKDFCTEIKRQAKEHNAHWANTPIPKEKDPLKQLLILQEENNKRFGYYGYKWEIEELIALYTAPMKFPSDIEMYQRFLHKLKPAISDIYNNLQQMNVVELSLYPTPQYLGVKRLIKHNYSIQKILEYLSNPNAIHLFFIMSNLLNSLIKDKIIPEYASMSMDKQDLMLLLYTWLEKNGASLNTPIYQLDTNSPPVIIIDDLSDMD